ncbi:MAG: sulfite exporter TauE/SafE family protein [Desulfobaccales bacterium]
MIGILIGLAAGVFGGLIGVGGGAVMIPLMVRFFKFSQHQGHGTSLMALVFTGLAGAVTYYSKGSVDLWSAALLAASAMLTARFGALYANALPDWRLKRAFGFFLIFISLLLLSKPYLLQIAFIPHHVSGWSQAAVLLATGVFTGFFSGMMGIGGGSIMVVAMVLFGGFSQYTAQGSSLLAMVPAALVGSYTHWRLGNVVLSVLPGLVGGITVGTYLGGSLAHLLSEADLRLVFAGMLILMGLRDIRGAAKKRAALASAD